MVGIKYCANSQLKERKLHGGNDQHRLMVVHVADMANAYNMVGVSPKAARNSDLITIFKDSP